MTIRVWVIWAISLLMILGCQAPQLTTSDTTPFDPALETWPHERSDVPVDTSVRYGRLSNGMRYALQSNGRPENEASLRLIIRAGAKHETDETLGLAHYLEHMAFNGTENVPEGEMVKSLERMGLAFGADTNASTTFSRTDYRLSLPEVDDETVDYALFLMREVADKMLIEHGAVERERGVVKAELARRQSPSIEASKAYQNYVQPTAYYNKRPVAGTPETLSAISAEDLRAFYETYYRPDRAFLVMVGDVDIDEMETKIKTQFADWSSTETVITEPDPKMSQTQGLSAALYEDPEITGAIRLYAAAGPNPRADSLATRREAMIRSIASNIVRLRFNKKLQEAGRPVLSAGLSAGLGKHISTTNASATLKDGDWESALRILDHDIRTARDYGFQQEELDELIANTRRSLTDAVNYSAKRRSANLLSGIAGAFAGGNVRTTPTFQKDYFEEALKTITLDDINKAFSGMWADFPHRIWLQGPDLGGLTEAEILDRFKSIRAETVEPPAQRRRLNFAYQDFGPAGKIASADRIEDFDIDQIVFENNVRLNLKKTDFEDGWIRLSVNVGEGWSAFPADKPGLSNLAGALASGGYEAHPASELSEIFAGKNVSFNFGVGNERLSMSSSTNADDILTQFQVWTALLTHAGYREEWHEKFIESIEASFHMIDSTPSGVASRDLSRIWHDGDKRYGVLPKEDYLALTLDDVRAVLEPQLKSGAIEIGVVGDFDKETIIDAVAKTFGALPARAETFTQTPNAFKARFPDPARVALTHTGKTDQGAIYMAWPMNEPWALQRTREHAVIRRVFQNRMTDIIREDLGLAYSPNAGLVNSRLSPGYGYASASMMADPQYFEAFEKAAKKIAADLRKGTITQDEVDRALTPLLESLESSEKENGTWLGLVTRSQTERYKLEWRRSRKTAFESMNIEALNRAVTTLFDPKGLHVVTIKSDKLN